MYPKLNAENIKKRDNLGNVGVNVRLTLMWSLKKMEWDDEEWIRVAQSRVG
jgi:hypothetical protein